MTRGRIAAVAAISLSSALGCDPVYEYCVAVTDCQSGAPLAGVRVRFDHEGLEDQTTGADGRACSSNVGDPGQHDVVILLNKVGFRPRRSTVRAGSELDAALCLCPQEDLACKEDPGSNPTDGGTD